jgi:hypothetical protein
VVIHTMQLSHIGKKGILLNSFGIVGETITICLFILKEPRRGWKYSAFLGSALPLYATVFVSKLVRCADQKIVNRTSTEARQL